MSTFFRKFKNVKPRDILHIFLFLGALPIALVYRLFRRDMWLICDNGKEASDNGFVLFRYVMEKHPEQDAVFAVCKNSPDADKVKATGPFVYYGSFKHWIYYLTARVNISSQKGGKPNYAVCHLLEVYGHLINNRVFLQHGVILTDIKFLYHKDCRFSIFTTSTEGEYRYVSDHYGYPEGVVQLLGLPRFDLLHDCRVKDGQILIIPTWREWLGTDALSKNLKRDTEKFLSTAYFENWSRLLKSPELQRLCEEKNLKIMFYLHRDAQRFADCFKTDNPYITVCKFPQYRVEELLKSSAMMVTDYSSVQADFAYMKKPICYFHFDYEDYSSKHYGRAYFDYSVDGFGPVANTAEGVVEAISSAADRGFAQDDAYLDRHKRFFTLYDRDNCKRNFDAIKSKWS